MTDRKLSASTELTTEPHDDDVYLVLDVSDTTDAATGTIKKIKYSTLKSLFPRISSGAGAPASTPAKVGDIYIDTTADNAYIAVGTTPVS